MQASKQLKSRAIKSSIWTVSSRVSSQLLRLVSNLLLTRLLMPEMFGLMSVANMLIFGLHLFSDIGLNQNLIQSKRGDEVEYVNTIWTLQILRGSLIFLMGLVLALGIYLLGILNVWSPNTVYAEPILPLIVMACSLNALITGFQSTKSALASRNLTIGRTTLLDLISQVIGIFVMVVWAYIDHSVWALVWGSLVSSFIGVYASHRFLPGESNFIHWDSQAFKEIFQFGKWVFLTSILGFLASSGDRLLLGGMISSKLLGLYSIAFMMVSVIPETFSRVVSSVVFPVFSEVVRDRPQDLKKTYYKFRALFDSILLISCGIIFVAGHIIIDLLYDARYGEAGYMFQILSISFIEARFCVTGQCYMALGKPQILAPLISTKLVVLFLSLPIAFQVYGMDGAIWSIALSGLATIPLTYYFKVKHLLFDLKKELLFLLCLPIGYILGRLVLIFVNQLKIYI